MAETPKWVDLMGIDPDYGETEGMELDRLRAKVKRMEGFAEMLEEGGNPFFAELIRVILED